MALSAIPLAMLETLFQSPSRGGHLRGDSGAYYVARDFYVSVPFTRGTPPWRVKPRRAGATMCRFSPLHEGDTSVASIPVDSGSLMLSVSVPFTRGTPPWQRWKLG